MESARYHDGCPTKPDVGGDFHGRSCPLWLFRFLHGGLFLLGLRDSSAITDRLLNRLIGHGADAGGGGHRDGLQHGQSGGDGQWAQKPEQHHRPQGVGIDFRQPFQAQPGQKHHGDDDTAGKAHVENFCEYGLHTITPA